MKELKNSKTIHIETKGEKFYNITQQVKSELQQLIDSNQSGMLHIFNPHTSCGLLISESFDSTAQKDLESFMKYLAPRNLPFISHTSEGPDDSPSHMKSLLLSPTLSLIVDQGELILGTWQGIFLCEFRDHKHQRKLVMKFQKD